MGACVSCNAIPQRQCTPAIPTSRGTGTGVNYRLGKKRSVAREATGEFNPAFGGFIGSHQAVELAAIQIQAFGVQAAEDLAKVTEVLDHRRDQVFAG